MPTLVHNVSDSSASLPYPFRGVLKSGQRVVLPFERDVVIAAFGGGQFLGDFRITSLSGEASLTPSPCQGDLGGISPAQVSLVQTFSAAPVWTVNHNFGRHPLALTVETLGGVEVEAEVRHVSLTQTLIYFDVPTAGVVKAL